MSGPNAMRGPIDPQEDQTMNDPMTLDIHDAYESAIAELAELRELFGMQQSRMEEAEAAWRDAHGYDAGRQPDLGTLLAWLLSERARATMRELYIFGAVLDVAGTDVCQAVLERFDATLATSEDDK